jgi:hypothetical protein
MKKQTKYALTGGIIFVIQWAILAGVSIAHDQGAFETWYRSIFRHPRLIALVCGVVMAVVVMWVCRPKDYMDVGASLMPAFVGNLLIDGIIGRVHGATVGETYYNSDLGFWADRLMYIFNNMIVVVIVLLAIMMYIAKGAEYDAKAGEVRDDRGELLRSARDKKDRGRVILAGMLCGTFMWGLSMADVMDRFMYAFFHIYDPNHEWSEFTSLIICSLILDIMPYIGLKLFNVINSRKQLVLFAASSFLTNALIYYVLDTISWWDGIDSGWGYSILFGVISFALVLLYVIILIDPMSRKTRAVA